MDETRTTTHLDDVKTFCIYMAQLETRVLIEGYRLGRWGRLMPIAIRGNSHFVKTPIAELLGTRFYWPEPAVIEYMGFRKRSTGFMAQAAEVMSFGLTTISAPLIVFSSVTVLDVEQLAPDLLRDFNTFKTKVVEARKQSG